MTRFCTNTTALNKHLLCNITHDAVRKLIKTRSACVLKKMSVHEKDSPYMEDTIFKTRDRALKHVIERSHVRLNSAVIKKCIPCISTEPGLQGIQCSFTLYHASSLHHQRWLVILQHVGNSHFNSTAQQLCFNRFIKILNLIQQFLYHLSDELGILQHVGNSHFNSTTQQLSFQKFIEIL